MAWYLNLARLLGKYQKY